MVTLRRSHTWKGGGFGSWTSFLLLYNELPPLSSIQQQIYYLVLDTNGNQEESGHSLNGSSAWDPTGCNQSVHRDWILPEGRLEKHQFFMLMDVGSIQFLVAVGFMAVCLFKARETERLEQAAHNGLI